jgi:hypothetical protein
MTMPLADVRIMAHPARGAAARGLRDRLGGLTGMDGLDPVIVWDPQPDGPVSAQRTARQAWCTPPRAGATHVVVLQDDVSVAADFGVRLAALLAAGPSRPLGLFAVWNSPTGQAVRLAAYLGLDWAPVCGSALSATGVALPAPLAERYGRFLASAADLRDSLAVYDFLAAEGEEPVIATPTLVEHDRPYRASIWPEKFVQGPRRSACHLPDVPAHTPRPSGRGLRRPAVLPYLSPDTLRSITTVQPGELGHPGGAGPQRVPSWQYAQLLGFDTAGLLDGFTDRELAAVRRALAGYVDAAFQYELWLTGFLVGQVLATADVGAGPDLESAAARTASGTLAFGCLARVLSLPVLERLAGPTADLVTHATRYGLDHHLHP